MPLRLPLYRCKDRVPAVSIVGPATGGSAHFDGRRPDVQALAKALKEAFRAPNEGDTVEDQRLEETSQRRAGGSMNVDGVVRFGGRTVTPSTQPAAAPAAASEVLSDAGTTAAMKTASGVHSGSVKDDGGFGAADPATAGGSGGHDAEDGMDVPMELSMETEASYCGAGPDTVANDDGDEPEPPGTSADLPAGTTKAVTAAKPTAAAAAAASNKAADKAADKAANKAAAESLMQFWARVPSRVRASRTESPPAEQQQQQLAFPPGFGLLDLPQAPEPSSLPLTLEQQPAGERRRRVGFELRSTYEGRLGDKAAAEEPPARALLAAAVAVVAGMAAGSPLAALAAPSAAAEAIPAKGSSREVSPAVEEAPSLTTVAAEMPVSHGGASAADAAAEGRTTGRRPLEAAVAAAEKLGGSEVDAAGSSGELQGRGGRREETGRQGRAGPSPYKRPRVDGGSQRDGGTDVGLVIAGPEVGPGASKVEAGALDGGSEGGPGALVGSKAEAGAGSPAAGPRAAFQPLPALVVDAAGEGEATELPPQQQQPLPVLPHRTLPTPWLCDGGGGGGGGSAGRLPQLPALMGADMALLDQLLPAAAAVVGSAAGAAVGGPAVGAAGGGGGLLPRLLQGLSALQVGAGGGGNELAWCSSGTHLGEAPAGVQCSRRR